MGAELKNATKNSGGQSIWQLGAAKSRMRLVTFLGVGFYGN